jgi:hypothetical protein
MSTPVAGQRSAQLPLAANEKDDDTDSVLEGIETLVGTIKMERRKVEALQQKLSTTEAMLAQAEADKKVLRAFARIVIAHQSRDYEGALDQAKRDLPASREGIDARVVTAVARQLRQLTKEHEKQCNLALTEHQKIRRELEAHCKTAEESLAAARRLIPQQDLEQQGASAATAACRLNVKKALAEESRLRTQIVRTLTAAARAVSADHNR